MKTPRLPELSRTILVTLTLFVSLAAHAKQEKFVCDEALLSARADAVDLASATALLNRFYSRGLTQFGPSPKLATELDARLVLFLAREADISLSESAQEYGLSCLSQSAFLGTYGEVTDEYRRKAAEGTLQVWLSRDRAAEARARLLKEFPPASAR